MDWNDLSPTEKSARLCAELAEAKARTDELERLHNWDVVHIAQREAELDRLRAELADTKAQLRHMYTFDSQHRGKLADMQKELAAERTVSNINLRRADKAEAGNTAKDARIKHMSGVLIDAEDLLGVEETGELILRPIERLIARAENAEADCLEWKRLYHVADARAEDLDTKWDVALARAERAEAERDALRAALEQIAHGIPGLTSFTGIARAALDPSPAGREEGTSSTSPSGSSSDEPALGRSSPT